jgi:DNA-3-methyladenine glycosylase II
MKAEHQQATDFLCTVDNDWAQLIRTVGACRFDAETEPTLNIYESLVQAVAYQQLHGKAGDAIFARFKNLFSQDGKAEFPAPEVLIKAQFDDLRACGFSGRKIETIQGIAHGAITGIVPSRRKLERRRTHIATCYAKRHRSMDGRNDVDIHPQAHGYFASG